MGEPWTGPIPIPTVKHYVVWYGPVLNYVYDNPVDSRDPEAYELDERADCFRIYDCLEMEWEYKGEVNRLRSKSFNFSPLYVPGGEVITGEERTKLFAPGGSLSNFGSPEKVVVIKTRYRSAEPFFLDPSEIVILPATQPA